MAFGYFILTVFISFLHFLYANTDNINVNIQLEYIDVSGKQAPITVVIANESAVIEAMMQAATQNAQYRFGGTYDGGNLGWLIEKYNKTRENLNTHFCWYFYIQLPGGNPIKQDYGVSTVTVTTDETLVLFRYELDEEFCRDFDVATASATAISVNSLTILLAIGFMFLCL